MSDRSKNQKLVNKCGIDGNIAKVYLHRSKGGKVLSILFMYPENLPP